MTDKLFPFRIGLPHNLMAKFRVADGDKNWHEADLLVTSKSTGTVEVYDMFDGYYGGRGNHLRNIYLTDISAELVELIKLRAEYLACVKCEKEDEDAFNARVDAAAAKILRGVK